MPEKGVFKFYIYSDKNVDCYVVDVQERQDACRSDATRILSQNNLGNKYVLNLLSSIEINPNSSW